MVAKSLIDDVLALPPDDRLRLIHLAWDSLIDGPGGIPLTEDQKGELDRRYDEYLANPDAGEGWDEVEAFVKARLRA